MNEASNLGDEEIEEWMEEWLSFWSPGNHDDRTIVFVHGLILNCQKGDFITSKSGKAYEFEKEHFASGGMKDVHWGKGKNYVVAFYRDEQDYNSRDRIENIVNVYRDRIFNLEGGDYWKELLVWPYDVVEHDGKLGIVCPVYDKTFFFKHGSVNGDMLGIKGKEKEGKWFASASNQNRFLDAKEKGDLRRYIQICIKLSRAVKRLHSAGLAHSDLSYKNVLVDPEGAMRALSTMIALLSGEVPAGCGWDSRLHCARSGHQGVVPYGPE